MKKNSNPTKPVKTVADPSVAAAEKRCAKAHSNLLDFQKTIIEIIEAKDWETLGYESFDKYWIDRFSDITLAIEILPHVVYELFREGADVDAVTDTVKGVSPESAANLKRQMDAGIPPAKARTTRKPRKPRAKGGDSTVFVHPGPERKARWEAAAATLNVSLAEFIIDVVDAAC